MAVDMVAVSVGDMAGYGGGYGGGYGSGFGSGRYGGGVPRDTGINIRQTLQVGVHGRVGEHTHVEVEYNDSGGWLWWWRLRAVIAVDMAVDMAVQKSRENPRLV